MGADSYSFYIYLLISIIYALLVFIFIILLFIDALKYGREIKSYLKYGFILSLFLILIDCAILIFAPNILEEKTIYEIAVIDLWFVIKIILFTCVGIYYCFLLNLPDFPLVKRILKAPNKFQKVLNKNYVFSTLVAIAAGVLFSFFLFKIFPPQVTDFYRKVSNLHMKQLGIGPEPSLALAFTFIEVAFSEELIFRLAFQNYLAVKFKLTDKKYWLAIIITSLIWALAHTGMLEPVWMKFVQIFPLGIILGVLFKRYGIEACMIAHGTFNIIMMYLGQYLIKV